MMECKTTYELHHNFAKLAEDSGFTFNTHKPRVHINWDEIRSIDIDNLLRDRKFLLIEKHVNNILDCVLESEFDVRILDQGVVKMFRLAQLTIEYQQFCRHYLDRSVYVLRNELNTVMQDLELARKDIRERDEEIRKLKKKSKHNSRPTPAVLYGHDNIANMILKTLSNNGEMFPSTSLLESSHQYNKCEHCEKVFLNQLYLKSHMIRRHPNLTNQPQKSSGETVQASNGETEHNALNSEILELKAKLLEMETTITTFHNSKIQLEEQADNQRMKEENNLSNQNLQHEIGSVIDNNLLNKIEEWKNEENIKYSKEIELLRNQMFETINSIKVQESRNTNQYEKELIEQLHKTINEQGQQILSLKQEVTDNILQAEKEKSDKKVEIEAQIFLWMQKVESQTQQYQQMVETLKQVAKEAQDSQAVAETERSRAMRLQALLDEQARNKEAQAPQRSIDQHHIATNTTSIKEKNNFKPNRRSELKSLQDLHQKAKALLNMKTSSSSSDDLGEHKYMYTPEKTKKKIELTKNKKNDKVKSNVNKSSKMYTPNEQEIKQNEVDINVKPTKTKVRKVRKEKAFLQNIKAVSLAPRSPIKVVRAKLTEEVNNRLIAAGVDPLKNGLHHTAYNKKRLQLQQDQRFKIKKNPAYEETRHSILAYLDTKAGSEKVDFDQCSNLTPTKSPKVFSFASVMSNVKNKALSLVKHNEMSKNERLSSNGVTKRAIQRLKTPPGSATSSQQSEQRSPTDSGRKGIISTFSLKDKEDKNTTKMQTITKSINDIKLNATAVLSSDEESITPESDEVSESFESDHKYYDSSFLTKSSKSIENLIKSPVRRPSTANGDYRASLRKLDKKDTKTDLIRTQSDSNILEVKNDNKYSDKKTSPVISNDIIEIVSKKADTLIKINPPEDNGHTSPKHAKGVLKNAPSTSSLNKKKVLFDLDAIQTKSISASPSQSTEKSDSNNEKYELGLINLDDDEWDISSIDNEPLKKNDDDVDLKIISRTTPKIAELKHTIESQLARRKDTPPTVLVGGVDLLRGPVTKAASIGGSNTSLGSSVFDDTDNGPIQFNTFVKPKIKKNEGDDSEVDISELSIDDQLMTNKKRDSF